ncbi:MAG: hypothetical protein KAJ14_15590 [Candidatus Omnitrophica bacterium]|nr:hypothetical protein [Candidatus Omnitrophota bacterium]
MKKKNKKLVSGFQLLMLCVIIPGLTGCTRLQSYYPMVPHPEVFLSTRQKVNNKPTVELQWKFQTNGKFRQSVTNRWSSHVQGIIKKADLFSEVKTLNSLSSDYTLNLTMNNVYSNLVGAIGQGVLSGLTLGLIGTKVTDNYECTATLTKLNGKSDIKEYKYAIVSTSGLIVSGVKGVKPRKQLDGAFSKILDQFLFKCIADFQKDYDF